MVNQLDTEDLSYADAISYSVEWDQGTSTWVTLNAADSLLLSYTVTGIASSSISYQFRYRAKNVFGYGPYSDVASILAIAIPDQMPAPIVTNNGVNVQITWVQANGNGASIIAYKIEILSMNG